MLLSSCKIDGVVDVTAEVDLVLMQLSCEEP